MEATTEKHKHAVGHQIQVELTEKLLDNFRKEANSWLLTDKISSETEKEIKDMMLQCGIDLPNDTYGAEMLIRGFILARGIAYKRNNGVPPIPFPVSFSTVDMAPWAIHEGEILLLLGRKPGQTQFQFSGGFRDPKETNAEAASRELEEEMLLKIEVSRFEQIDQLFIDDPRYRESCHKITTSLFNTHITYEEMLSAKAGDDLEEVKIFSLNKLIKDNTPIRDMHKKLFEMLWQYLLSVPEQALYITPKS
jgi:ADP-ribose pyrophosphatase YjhB (NUDIX family)